MINPYGSSASSAAVQKQKHVAEQKLEAVHTPEAVHEFEVPTEPRKIEAAHTPEVA